MGNLVIVATYNERMEAEVARTALEAAGIQVLVSGNDIWHAASGGMSSVTLQVDEADVEAAREVLAGG